jgi:hypothetical protein
VTSLEELHDGMDQEDAELSAKVLRGEGKQAPSIRSSDSNSEKPAANDDKKEEAAANDDDEKGAISSDEEDDNDDKLMETVKNADTANKTNLTSSKRL